MREFLTNQMAAHLHLEKGMTQKAIGELYGISAPCVYQKIHKHLRARELDKERAGHQSLINHHKQMVLLGNIQACAESIASSENVKPNH